MFQSSWKTEVVDALFLPYEAEVIKGIPLSSQLPTNKKIWTFNYNGLFSVHSTYQGALKLHRPRNNGVNTQFCTHNLIKENDLNDQSMYPKNHNCITCTNLFLHCMLHFVFALNSLIHLLHIIKMISRI